VVLNDIPSSDLLVTKHDKTFVMFCTQKRKSVCQTTAAAMLCAMKQRLFDSTLLCQQFKIKAALH
jgi:hypothetical protein